MSKVFINIKNKGIVKVNCIEWDYDIQRKIVYLQVEGNNKIIVAPVVDVENVIVA